MPASPAAKPSKGRPARSSGPDVDAVPPRPGESVDPTAAVATMASAVERLRRMAATVFRGDAALFADPTAAAATTTHRQPERPA